MIPKTVTSGINNPELTISLENNLSGYTESINLHNRSGSFVATLALIYQNKCELTIMSLTLVYNPIKVRVVLQSTYNSMRIYLAKKKNSAPSDDFLL